MSDLSLHHSPVGDFLSGSLDPGEQALTDRQVDEFHANGFLVGIPMLDGDQVDGLLGELSHLQAAAADPRWYEFNHDESEDPDSVLFHALGAWRLAPAFHDLLWHPRFVSAAEQLLGGPIRFWHDQLFCKPAGHGGVVSWHQDYSYWSRTSPMRHLTCWIALDDANAQNGVIQYIPGSHNWDLLPVTGLGGDMNAIREVLDDDQWKAFTSPVQPALKKGECTFHHPLTIHGSSKNLSATQRRATVINVIRDGVQSATGEPLLSGVPPIPAGEPLDGQFFPLLSETS